MTTAEADTLLKTQRAGTQRDLIFLDVRERAEREMGTLPGAIFLRCVHCGRRSTGWDINAKPLVRQPAPVVSVAPKSRVVPFSRAAAAR